MTMKRLAAIVILLALPALVWAETGKTGWKRNYTPRDSSEAELLKACAYGNIKACYAYHDTYIVRGPGEKGK
jgi:hypothetical protein